YLGSNNEPMDLRDAFGADVVLYVVINGGTQFLGLANLAGYPPFPPPGECYAPFAQAALIKSKAVNPGDYVFAHEFAHLFGANHDRGSITQPNPTQPVGSGSLGLRLVGKRPRNQRGQTDPDGTGRCGLWPERF